MCENLQAIDDGILAAAWASNGARSIRNGDRFLTSTSRWPLPVAAARGGRPGHWPVGHGNPRHIQKVVLRKALLAVLLRAGRIG